MAEAMKREKVSTFNLIFMLLKGMSDERHSRPTFVGVVELPDKIGEP